MIATSFSRRAAFVLTLGALAACQSGQSTPAASPSPTPATAAPSSAASAPAGGMTGSALPAGVTAQMVHEGDSLFNNGGCQRCHGKGGIGAANGPALAEGKWTHTDGSYEQIVKIVTTGVAATEIKDPTRTFPMRARGGTAPLLTDDQVRAVAAYVYSISHR